jgi:hypothetical protein
MNVYQKINAVQKAVKYIQKNKSVNAGGSSYNAVTHDHLVAVARQAMVDNGLVIVPVQKDGEMLIHRDLDKGIKMHLYSGTYEVRVVNADEPQDYVECVVQAHAGDNGDKAPGKALTYAVKAALIKLLWLESGDDEESIMNPPEWTPAQEKEFNRAFKAGDAVAMYLFSHNHREAHIALSSSFADDKTANKKQIRGMEAEGVDKLNGWAQEIENYASATDLDGVLEVTGALGGAAKKFVWDRLSFETQSIINELKKEAA